MLRDNEFRLQGDSIFVPVTCTITITHQDIIQRTTSIAFTQLVPLNLPPVNYFHESLKKVSSVLVDLFS